MGMEADEVSCGASGMGTRDDEARRATVGASPALVAVHDRRGWLALFDDEGEVEDPVGSLPVRVRAGDRSRLAAFWDTYIGPNEIRFEVHQDFVDGDDVLRDVTIHTTLSTGARLAVPSYVLYRLVPGPQGAGFRIRRLAAHWEILPMVAQVLRQGPRGWWTIVVMTGRIVRYQGLRGLVSYLRSMLAGFTRARGRRLAVRLAGGATPEKVVTAGRTVAFRVGSPNTGQTEVHLYQTNGIRTFRSGG